MNEVVLSNTYMPVVAECGLLTASEPFYHMDRVTDFNVMIYVTDGVIYVTEDETDYEINAGEILFFKKRRTSLRKTRNRKRNALVLYSLLHR